MKKSITKIIVFNLIIITIFFNIPVKADDTTNEELDIETDNITNEETNIESDNTTNEETNIENDDTTNNEENIGTDETPKDEENTKTNDSNNERKNTIDDKPNIEAESAVLMESSTEKELYSKNADQKMYPASTTKILTAIITIENCNLDDIVTVPYEALATIPSGYSVASLQAGEELTVEELLEVLLVHSANDAANVLAFHISGDLDAFATLMNNKVNELGLKNTHFTNPSGQHNDNHYTTAHDLAIIMKYCMKNQEFRRLCGLKYCTIPATNKYEERVFQNTNAMLNYDSRNIESNYYYKYMIAGKTGYTTQAKNCLVSVSNKDGFELISVVLSCGLYENGLSSRYIDTKSLFEYGYNNYAIKKISEQNAIITNVDIQNASKETKNLDLITEKNLYALMPLSEYEKEFKPQITIQNNLEPPITQGSVLGKVTYSIDGIDYSTNLLASHNVEKTNYTYLILSITILIIILVILLLLILSYPTKKRKKSKKKKTRKN